MACTLYSERRPSNRERTWKMGSQSCHAEERESKRGRSNAYERLIVRVGEKGEREIERQGGYGGGASSSLRGLETSASTCAAINSSSTSCSQCTDRREASPQIVHGVRDPIATGSTTVPGMNGVIRCAQTHPHSHQSKTNRPNQAYSMLWRHCSDVTAVSDGDRLTDRVLLEEQLKDEHAHFEHRLSRHTHRLRHRTPQ